MEKKQSEFNKVFSAWDILVIAFGAMIGWGWVVSSGGWIQKGGVLGAALGFVVGGVMIFFVGLTYAELTAAMPQCGGEHVEPSCDGSDRLVRVHMGDRSRLCRRCVL